MLRFLHWLFALWLAVLALPASSEVQQIAAWLLNK